MEVILDEIHQIILAPYHNRFDCRHHLVHLVFSKNGINRFMIEMFFFYCVYRMFFLTSIDSDWRTTGLVIIFCTLLTCELFFKCDSNSSFDTPTCSYPSKQPKINYILNVKCFVQLTWHKRHWMKCFSSK